MTTTTEVIFAYDLAPGDVIHGTTSTYGVLKVIRMKRGPVQIKTTDGTWAVDRDRKITVTATVTCWNCDGSGIYYGAGHVENGVFKGMTGPCFRCRGTGTQTRDDMIRNHHYDNHTRTFAMS